MRKTRVKFLKAEASLFTSAIQRKKGILLTPQESLKIVKRGWREEKKPISRKYKVSRKKRQRERESEVVEMSVSVKEEGVVMEVVKGVG